MALGTHVEIELIANTGAHEPMSLDIVEETQADLARGFLGINTPLAQAILNQPAGVTVTYPRGDIVQVRLLAVSPAVNVPPPDAEAKRQAALRKAVDKADLTNAISYALTAENKWGDYDP